MTTDILFSIIGLVLIIILILIWNKIDNTYKKGYKAGAEEATRSMLETASWLGAKVDKTSFNTLWLFASKYQKYGYVSSDKFRTDLSKLDNSKRILDLSKEEIDHLV